MTHSILITGGAGFIGSFIVDELIRRGHEVSILDSLDPQVHSNGPPVYLNPKASFIKGSITDRKILEPLVTKADIIFHEAAAVGVGQSMYQIEHYMGVNSQGTSLLLDLLVNKKHSVKKIIVAASMSSYGEGLYEDSSGNHIKPPLRSVKSMKNGEWEPKGADGVPMRPIATPETAMQDVNSIYALSKKIQEDAILLVGKTYGIPSVALRYFNVYGPRQSLSNPYTGVSAIFMSRLKNDHAPVIYEDGLQTRDFISVHDIVQANMLAMEKNAADYEIFNVGSNNPRTIKSISEDLARLLGKNIAPNITGQYRKGDVRHCFADISKIQKKLGFNSNVSFEDGMKELLTWSSNVKAEDHFDQAAAELKEKGLL